MSTISQIEVNSIKHDIRASKLGSSTVGGSTKPIYLKNGIPTECADMGGLTEADVLRLINVQISNDNTYEPLDGGEW